MTCEHWDLELDVPCTREATVVASCVDVWGETWTGRLCNDHLSDYRADPEINVVGVQD